MAQPSDSLTLDAFPPELVLAVAQEASCDADRVGVFLEAFFGRLGLLPAEGRPSLFFPRDFLLELAAALRLLVWEKNGICIHREAGLPPADQAVRDAFRWLNPPGTPEAADQRAQLMPRVLALFIERCAWSGRIELGADVVLGVADEDRLVEAMADFMWSHRHDLRNEPSNARTIP